MPAQRYPVIRPVDSRSLLAGLDQFELAEPTVCSSEIVVEPGSAIYGLDDATGSAVFTRSAPIAELLAAPFFYLAQKESARELITVPYAEFHDLAAELPDPTRLCLLYSTGRAGSTLLGQALAATTDVTVVSEPDAYTWLVGMRDPESSADAELVSLARSITRFLAHACSPVADGTMLIKFRGYATHIADLMRQAQPDATSLFLTRDLDGWMRSMGRLVRIGDPDQREGLLPDSTELFHFPLSRFIRLPGAGAASATAVETLALAWVSIMRAYLDLQAAGVVTAAIDYRRLMKDPRQAIAAIARAYGLEQLDPGALDAVLAQDSQAGTAMSGRDLARDQVGELTPEDLVTGRRVAVQFGAPPELVDHLPGALMADAGWPAPRSRYAAP